MNVTTLPDLQVVRGESGKIEARRVIGLGMENAKKVGTEIEGRVYVENDYTGKRLLVTAGGILHGLNGSKYRLMTNARLGAVVGDLLKNAVPINALNDTARGVDGTYAMIAYVADEKGREVISIITVEQKDGSVSGIESFDVLHAISGRQKNSSQADTKSQGLIPIKATKISIVDLLNIVKTTHQSILPENVLTELGEKRNPKGDYADKAKFSLRGARDLEHQVADLQKQNARLQARNEELRSRLESGGAVKVDETEAKRMRRSSVRNMIGADPA